jgi:hypothetical protein
VLRDFQLNCSIRQYQSFMSNQQGGIYEDPDGSGSSPIRSLTAFFEVSDLDRGSYKSAVIKDAQGTTVFPSAESPIPNPQPETTVVAEEKFRLGDRMMHKRFGIGEIRDVHGTKAIVRFLEKGEKKLLTHYLEPANWSESANA